MNIETKWEQVESPEYISFCEANHIRYILSVSDCGHWIKMKYWMTDNPEDFRVMTTGVYNPFEKITPPIPYRITSTNGTYSSPMRVYTDWDKEFESLKDWLKYKIDTMDFFTLINVDLVLKFKATPEEMYRCLIETGIVYFQVESPNDIPLLPLSFEAWKKEKKINNCLLL